MYVCVNAPLSLFRRRLFPRPKTLTEFTHSRLELLDGIVHARALLGLAARRTPRLADDECRGDGEQEALCDKICTVLDGPAS